MYHHVPPFYLQSAFMFCSNLRAKSNYDISLYLLGITGLVFITEVKCVYCPVRVDSLNTSGVRPQVCPCQIYGAQSGTGTGFSGYSVFLLLVSFHLCAIPIITYMLLLLEGQMC